MEHFLAPSHEPKVQKVSLCDRYLFSVWLSFTMFKHLYLGQIQAGHHETLLEDNCGGRFPALGYKTGRIKLWFPWQQFAPIGL